MYLFCTYTEGFERIWPILSFDFLNYFDIC
jgi:hypothetical protein